jgi:hypothetical protein
MLQENQDINRDFPPESDRNGLIVLRAVKVLSNRKKKEYFLLFESRIETY